MIGKDNWDETRVKWTNYWQRKNEGRPLMCVIARDPSIEAAHQQAVAEGARPFSVLCQGTDPTLPADLVPRDMDDLYTDAVRMDQRYRRFCATHHFLGESFPNIDADFVTINNYLAVVGQTTITDLDITSHLYTASIDSKSGLINLAGGTLLVDAGGQVAINGDLTITGKITATELNLERLNIYNESGVAVATIDASGSANLASLTTGMITIASAGDSTSSSLLASSISTNATAGEAVLVAPDTELVIESPHVNPNTLVYLTPTGNTGGKVLFVKAKNTCPTLESSSSLLESNSSLLEPCVPSFTVGIDAPISTDISFNWWIIQLDKKL